MSNCNIITNSAHKEIRYDIELHGSIGFPTLKSYEYAFKDKLNDEVGCLKIKGYSNNTKDIIEIYFDISDAPPSYEEFVEMINEVVGTNNKFENYVEFNCKFYEITIKEIMATIYNKKLPPFIDENMYELLKLNKLLTDSSNDVYLISENDEYRKSYPDELNWMTNAKLNLKTKKMEFRYTHNYETIEANVDHEKLYNFYVKDENPLVELKKLFPFIKI